MASLKPDKFPISYAPLNLSCSLLETFMVIQIPVKDRFACDQYIPRCLSFLYQVFNVIFQNYLSWEPLYEFVYYSVEMEWHLSESAKAFWHFVTFHPSPTCHPFYSFIQWLFNFFTIGLFIFYPRSMLYDLLIHISAWHRFINSLHLCAFTLSNGHFNLHSVCLSGIIILSHCGKGIWVM